MAVDKTIQAYKKEFFATQKRLMKLIVMEKKTSVIITNDSGEVFEFEKVTLERKTDKLRRYRREGLNEPFRLYHAAGENNSRKRTSMIEFNHIFDPENTNPDEETFQGLTVLGGLSLKDYSGENNSLIMHKAKIVELKKKDGLFKFVISSETVHPKQTKKSEIKVIITERPRVKIPRPSADEQKIIDSQKAFEISGVIDYLQEIHEALSYCKKAYVEITNDRTNEITLLKDVQVNTDSLTGSGKDTTLKIEDKDSSDVLTLSVSEGFWKIGVMVRFSRPLSRRLNLCKWSDFDRGETKSLIEFKIDDPVFIIRIVVEL